MVSSGLPQHVPDSTQQCPSAWGEYIRNGIRACERPTLGGCSGNIYNVDHQYGKICGKVIGYQLGSPDVFPGGARSINSAYIE